MQTLIAKLCLVVAVAILCIYSITPPERQLRLGKDLRGGVSLIYQVQLRPTDPPETIAKVIDVLKNRVDPQGLAEISIVTQGRDRIEITMPLPNERVMSLKRAFEAELAKFQVAALDAGRFEQIMRLSGPERQAEIDRVSAGLPTRARLLREAGEAADAARVARQELSAAQAELSRARAENAAAATIEELQRREVDLVAKAADAELKYDEARRGALAASLSPDKVRRVMQLPIQPQRLTNAQRQIVTLPSAREQALADLKERFPDQAAQLDATLAAFERFAAERTVLDDAADLERLISGAGVLDFRIAINPGTHAQEERLRRELRERGPRNVQSSDARWYKINRIENWYDSVEGLQALRADPAGYFRGRGFVGEEFGGEYFLLLWDVAGNRLTSAEGEWAVARAVEGVDQVGRPAINFEMDARGAVLLGDLTRKHVGDKMAVLLDDQIYTAPVLQSTISKNGQITGNFTRAEISYITRVLGAGSLQAKLSPEPIGRSNLGPALGADNLRRGLETGVWAFVIVSLFMCVYYFPKLGLIAVVALAFNLILILGVMAMNRAAFTLPGIAGVVLTFGQAVDANVLIYERMREEFRRGHDLKTAVRLGFSKAFSSILDGNVTNLIICAVLYNVASQEIKGFAITLAIGILATLFGTLVVSRLLFTLFVDHLGWRRTSMLPMAVPGLQKVLMPRIDWIRLRWFFYVASVVMFVLALGISLWRGPAMLDTAFRGGTQIDLTFKADETGQPMTLTRQMVEDRVRRVASEVPIGHPLRLLANAEILPVNPRQDGVTSDRFQIKTFEVEDDAVLEAITGAFSDVIEQRPALSFSGRGEPDWRRSGAVYKVLSPVLGEDIDRPDLRDDVTPFFGGVAIVVENIDPPVSRDVLLQRLNEMRLKPEFSDTVGRTRDVRVIEGTSDAARAAVLLVRDDAVSSFDNEERWIAEVASREWRLVNLALGEASQLANVQSFSPTIAAAFTAQAIVSVVLSVLLLTIYVWVRFGAGRWAVAATLPLLHDIMIIVGLLALSQVVFYQMPGLAGRLGILPFKIDLNIVAALLTIAGYSLNDTIIILDRIRENKGKALYATTQQINDSINQTISRTFITSGTTLISTAILYVFGGEAVRGFAFAFNLGVIIGTYSSIAISAPLVWSRKLDVSQTDPRHRSGGSAAAVAPRVPVPTT